MLKKILLSAIAAVAGAIPLRAQFDLSEAAWYNSATKADLTFRLCDRCVTQRHKASIANGNSMTIELYVHSAYDLIPDLEATLAGIRSNLSFVADSVRDCPQCNFRIDYALNRDGSSSYRLRKYPALGTFLYAKGGGELQPFEPEADTLHLLIQQPITDVRSLFNQAQVTFVLNRFANLDSILAQKGYLNRLVDTMRIRSTPIKRRDKTHPTSYKTSINLIRYEKTGKTYMMFQRGLVKDGIYTYSGHSAFDVQVNFGAGFLRDRIAPVAEAGLIYRLPATRGDEFSELFVGLYGSGYFAFAKGADGLYNIHDNWFVNAEFGGEGENNAIYALKLSRLSMGFGYLVSGKGGYFTGTTMKAFMNFRLKNGVTLTPEIIATDNFHQVFPGFTVKIF